MTLELRSRVDEDDMSGLDVTELLSLEPDGMDTYCVQLARGAVLCVNMQAEGPICLRLLDKETWESAQTPEARRIAPCRYSAVCAQNVVAEFPASESGDYLLLVWNDSDLTTVNVILGLSTRASGEQRPLRKAVASVAAVGQRSMRA